MAIVGGGLVLLGATTSTTSPKEDFEIPDVPSTSSSSPDVATDRAPVSWAAIVLLVPSNVSTERKNAPCYCNFSTYVQVFGPFLLWDFNVHGST